MSYIFILHNYGYHYVTINQREFLLDAIGTNIQIIQPLWKKRYKIKINGASTLFEHQLYEE